MRRKVKRVRAPGPARPATGYLGLNAVVRGRPPERGVAKRQGTLRLDPDLIDRFRAEGPEWHPDVACQSDGGAALGDRQLPETTFDS